MLEGEFMPKIVKEIIPYILVIIFACLIKFYIGSPIKVNGTSMDPTLKDGDIMILNKAFYSKSKIKRFDIVVVKYQKEDIIKRVIGLPGDIVEYKNNQLYINHKKVKENYKHGETEDFNIYVPKEKYLILGDNREVSLDSRRIGPVSVSDIEGHASLTIFPFSRFGTKK